MIRHKISHQSKMIFSLIHLSVGKNGKYYESILIVSNIFRVICSFLLNSLTQGFCISYFGTLLLPIILWRLRWNLRCRINFFNSLTINLEMLSLCWNNESSYTDVSWGSHNLYSALSNRKQLFETFEFITFAINHDYSELMDP